MVPMYRQYTYNEETHSFSSLGELHFHNRCILTLKYIICPSPHPTETAGVGATDSGLEGRSPGIFLCSAATDGRVAVWCVDLPPLAWGRGGSGSGGVAGGGVGPSSEQSSLSPQPVAVCQAHQSGINDMATHQGSHCRLSCCELTPHTHTYPMYYCEIIETQVHSIA